MKDGEFRIIYRPRRRRIAMRLAPDEVVEILTPPGVPEEFIRQLYQQNRGEIERLRARWAENIPRQAKFEENENFALLGRFYPLHLSKRLKLFDGGRFIIPDGSPEEKKNHLIQLYREIASTQLLRRAEKMEQFTGLHASSWRISSTERRWGSCNSKGQIALSWKLVQCPPELIDYVIIHELSHLKELNHSRTFWQNVGRFCPDFRERRNKLNEFARNLPQL